MIIGAINQTDSFETRTALTPQSTALFKKLGFSVIIEKDTGAKAGFDNTEYTKAGASIKNSADEIIKECDILLSLNNFTRTANLKENSFIIGDFGNLIDEKIINNLKKKKINCFALEKMPRLSRAQPFDILSSQNNLSGYRAVIEATSLSPKAAPMMITSAGTLPPLKFLIIGVGVAGLQAIATAKRLGGKVYASDPREEVRDQIKSLGASFVEDITTILNQCDIIISSAFSAGKKAPLIINKQLLNQIPPDSVLIDMASKYGGNIEGSKDNEITYTDRRIIYGNSLLAAKVPFSASLLLANNFYNFVNYIYAKQQQNIVIDLNDPLINETLVTKD